MSKGDPCRCDNAQECRGEERESRTVRCNYCGIQNDIRNLLTRRDEYFVWLSDEILTASRCCR